MILRGPDRPEPGPRTARVRPHRGPGLACHLRANIVSPAGCGSPPGDCPRPPPAPRVEAAQADCGRDGGHRT
ncbi:hypothetical protein NDU88_003258 [Pleurodeles waltl]|uniref:Uncharacterized protein n=1 Tax=Pleurodeles waltl TaxID=8319 RepID=A0AAV7VF95_PLEWA|nr:hypothetical protein NDU88_003258 [Pleurodeles waltl]